MFSLDGLFNDFVHVPNIGKSISHSRWIISKRASHHTHITIFDSGMYHLTKDTQFVLTGAPDRHVAKIRTEKRIIFIQPLILGTKFDFYLKRSGATICLEEVVDVSLLVSSSSFNDLLGFLVVEGFHTLNVSLLDSR